MQIEVHKTVAARPPAVFKIVADIMNWPQIIGSVTAIELLTRGRVRVGTRVRLTRIMHGHQMTEDWRWKRSSGRAGCGCSEKVALCITSAISVHADLKIDYSPEDLPSNQRVPASEGACWRIPMAQASSAARKELKKSPTTAKMTVSLHVNGVERKLVIAPWTTLLDALRLYLDLTGTKKGCDHGQCGACTVLVDGRRINSCLALAVMKDGAQVKTIEGLAQGSALHPLQQAFIKHDAFQCGYCTPGQICSAAGLIAEGKAHTSDEIRELMSGNICRCGAYPNIVAAIEEVISGKVTKTSGEAGQ